MYKHTLLLYRLVKNEIPLNDWIDLNFQQTFNNRANTYKLVKANSYKVGNNLLCNRFPIINAKIEFGWTQGSFDTYKIKCKEMFLKSNRV